MNDRELAYNLSIIIRCRILAATAVYWRTCRGRFIIPPGGHDYRALEPAELAPYKQKHKPGGIEIGRN